VQLLTSFDSIFHNYTEVLVLQHLQNVGSLIKDQRLHHTGARLSIPLTSDVLYPSHTSQRALLFRTSIYSDLTLKENDDAGVSEDSWIENDEGLREASLLDFSGESPTLDNNEFRSPNEIVGREEAQSFSNLSGTLDLAMLYDWDDFYDASYISAGQPGLRATISAQGIPNMATYDISNDQDLGYG